MEENYYFLITLGAFVLLFIIYWSSKNNLEQFVNSCTSSSNITPNYGFMERSFVRDSSIWDNIYYYFPFPFFRPYWYRNVGEMTDPYYPNYWQTYWNDMPYFYYTDYSFDRYKKV